MGIREKENARQAIKSNVAQIIGIEIKENKDDIKSSNTKLTHKAYYITEEQYRKLRVLSAETYKDMSLLVREALDLYLAKNAKK